MHTLLFEAGRVRCRQNCPTCRRGFPCPEYEARYYHVVSAAAYEQLDYTYACDRFRPQDLYIESQLLARVVMLAMESATNEVRICEIRFQDCHRCQTQASASVRKKNNGPTIRTTTEISSYHKTRATSTVRERAPRKAKRTRHRSNE